MSGNTSGEHLGIHHATLLKLHKFCVAHKPLNQSRLVILIISGALSWIAVSILLLLVFPLSILIAYFLGSLLSGFTVVMFIVLGADAQITELADYYLETFADLSGKTLEELPLAEADAIKACRRRKIFKKES